MGIRILFWASASIFFGEEKGPGARSTRLFGVVQGTGFMLPRGPLRDMDPVYEAFGLEEVGRPDEARRDALEN